MIYFCVLVGLLLAGSYCRVEALFYPPPDLHSLDNRIQELERQLGYGGKQYELLSVFNSKPSSLVIVNYSYMFAWKRMHIDHSQSTAAWSFIMSSMPYVATSCMCAVIRHFE